MKKSLFQILPMLKYVGMYVALAIALVACSDNSVQEEGKPEPNPDSTPEYSEEVSKYVPIDWNETEIEMFDLETGEVTLTFFDNIPQMESGLSVIVLETDTSAYIRRIMQSTIEGNTVRLQTREAKMTELFADTELSISFTPSAARVETRTGSMASVDEAGVLHPVKIVELNGDGTYQTLYDAKSPSRIEIGVGDRIVLFKENLPGRIIGSYGNLALSWESFIQEVSLGVDAYFKFTKPIHDVELTENLKVKVSELEKGNFSFDGNVLSEMIMRADMEGDFEYTSEPETLKEFKPVVFKFMTPTGIPVIFTLSSELFFQVSADGKSKNVARVGVAATGGFKLGVEYKGNSKWEPIKDINYSYNVIPLEIEGKSEVNVKASLYPEIKLKLYGFLGPVISPKVYVRDELRFGFFEQFGSVSDDYYAWSEKLFAGVDLSVDLGIEFIDWKIPSISLYDGNLMDKQFYNAPDDIKLVSPVSGSEATIGKEIPVRFNVTRELMTKNFPVAAVAVKFESKEGKVSHDFVMTGPLGNADVLWTPLSKNALLTAKIFDENGEVIAEDSFIPRIEEEEVGSIVGTWERVKTEVQMIYQGQLVYTTSSSPSDYGYRDFWVLREDGTFDGYDTDAVAWPYGTYTFTGGSLNIHYLNDSGSDEIAPVIKLTDSELVLRSVTENSELNKSMTFFYVRVTDQNLIDKIDQETKQNPAKRWK